MTWIDEIRKNVKKKYKISPYISENYTVRYKKYYHRATFRSNREDFLSSSFMWSSAIAKELGKSLGNSVRIRNSWYEIYVYFSDLDHLLDSIPKKHIKKLSHLEIMDPVAIAATKEFSHEYPVELVIRNKLPFDKYRYRVYTVSSYTEKARIGEQNLKALQNAITVYDGIRLPRRQYSFYNYSPPNDYFYAETLDFLQMIYLMEPKYIRSIQQFKTTKELNQHDSTS